MKTLNQIYKAWSYVDGHGDKGTAHTYIEEYDKLFTPFRDKPINFLEIGIAYGESLEMWHEYFDNAQIYGADIRELEIYSDHFKPGGYRDDARFKILIGDATKKEFLSNFPKDLKFDIIIDDGSHYFQDQFDSFSILKSKMNKGGLYIIEDVANISIMEDDFKSMHKKNKTTIIDNRLLKNRQDDVLIVYQF